MKIEDLLQDASSKKGIEIPQSSSPLVSLETDLKIYIESLKEVAQDIIQEGISQYPIFVAHQSKCKIGELILDNQELATVWSISVTYLEDCVERQIVLGEKTGAFKRAYKNPNQYVCLLVVTMEGANFVFYPYPLV